MILDIEEIREKYNETGLKEGKRYRNVNLQCFHIRDARFLRFELLTFNFFIDHR